MHIRTRVGLLLAFAAVLGARPAAAQADGVTPAMVTQGDSIFHSKGNCYACHGTNALGAVGPNLTDSEWIHSDGSYEAIVKQVTTGVPQACASISGIPNPSPIVTNKCTSIQL